MIKLNILESIYKYIMSIKTNDLENGFDQSVPRLSSKSKKKIGSKIHIYSKTGGEHSQNLQPNTPHKSQDMQKSTGQHHHVRRMYTMNEDYDHKTTNLLKLMQEQLEMHRKIYQDKMNEHLKINTIQLTRLQNIINSHADVLSQKDRQISQLSQCLRSMSPSASQAPQNNLSFFSKKLSDCETKLRHLTEHQSVLNDSVGKLNSYLERVEKGLISCFSVKLFNIQNKVNSYIDAAKVKISGADQFATNCTHETLRKSKSKNQMCSIRHHFDVLADNFQIVKQEVKTFKQKQYKYENHNLNILKEQLSSLRVVLSALDDKFNERNKETPLKKKTSELSSKLEHKKISQSKHKVNQWSISQFSDYNDPVYEGHDSSGDDQFFYDGEKHDTDPQINHSFQKFESQQQDEDTPNQRRLIETIQRHGYRLPLAINIDYRGFVRVKHEGIYLLDKNKEHFQLNTLEINRLQHRGIILL